MPSKQPPTPECDKMVAVSEESNMIGAFLAWLRDEMNLHICEWVSREECGCCGYDGGFHPMYRGDSGIERILAKFYKIDLDKVEQERRALLAWLRERA